MLGDYIFEMVKTKQTTEAENALQNLVKGSLPSTLNKFENPVIKGHKLSNEYLVELVKAMKKKEGIADKSIIDAILKLDKLAEKESLTNEVLKNYLKQ